MHTNSHCLTESHAKKMGLTIADGCRRCKEPGVGETLEHLLCECPALAPFRLAHLNSPFVDSMNEAAKKLCPKVMLKFATSVNVMQDF